jgi:hypothetical protein
MTGSNLDRETNNPDWGIFVDFLSLHGSPGQAMTDCSYVLSNSLCTMIQLFDAIWGYWYDYANRYINIMWRWDKSSEITQCRVTIATNYQALILYMWASHVAGNERPRSLFFSVSCVLYEYWEYFNVDMESVIYYIKGIRLFVRVTRGRRREMSALSHHSITRRTGMEYGRQGGKLTARKFTQHMGLPAEFWTTVTLEYL